MIAEGPTREAEDAQLDPRRWATLAIVLLAVVIAALDTTILNVAIPTVMREFDATLSSIQWVITGYSLTFGAFLIIGGRLGDIFGARRMFVVGAALFGVGSLIASLSTGVASLVVGEAVVEGLGAAMMLPATMGILSSTFHGRERATAFAAWGAVMGAAVAFGPLIGGFLTTNYSWRWGFRINVIVAPLAILGALLVMPRVPTTGRRERIDLLGALLIASGMFLLVFGISEGGRYGWFRPLHDFGIGGASVWPTAMPVSVSAAAFTLAIGLLVAFFRVQVAKERAGADPLFEFSNLERPAFRWGILTLLLSAAGQVSLIFVLSVVLQDLHHLSAVDTGLWLVPTGVSIVVGSQVGGWLTRIIGTTTVVRVGLVVQALGLAATAIAVGPDLTFVSLLPGFAMFGIGIGFAGSQLNNVILADVAPERSGAASGANSTVRMIGASLGIAIASTLLSTQTPRTPLVFAAVVVAIGAAMSMLIPRVGPAPSLRADRAEDELARTFEDAARM